MIVSEMIMNNRRGVPNVVQGLSNRRARLFERPCFV